MDEGYSYAGSGYKLLLIGFQDLVFIAIIHFVLVFARLVQHINASMELFWLIMKDVLDVNFV